MAEGWRDLAHSGRTAAYELFERKRWRSCASRAYYATYSEVTHALLAAGTTMPASQNNPKHKTLADLVTTNLRSLNLPRRTRLAAIVIAAYNLRIAADYLPDVDLDESDARDAIGLMATAFSLLKGLP